MFSAFKRSIPQISIFHKASVPASQKALQLMLLAASSPYPPGKSSPPLSFDLEVVDNLPTIEQIRTIGSYLSRGSLSSFLSVDPASADAKESVGSPEQVLLLAGKNPSSFRYPVVVDWTSGKASVGDVEGVYEILENLRKKRDGEIEDDQVDKPKGWFS